MAIMNILRFLYPKQSLKRKVWDIESDIEKITQVFCKDKFWVQHYGAIEIDPKYLVFWICVESDMIKLNLQKSQQLENALRKTLADNNYPANARSSVLIGFESQETVNRESGGNWYSHFK